jgi:protein-tyrosine phosphatase
MHASGSRSPDWSAMQEQGREPSRAPDDARREAMRTAARRIDRVNEWLQLGGALPPEEYGRLCQAGITHVVDLREEGPDDVTALEAFELARQHVPVPDQGAPMMEQLIATGAWLRKRHDKACAYVHCGGGFGRASTMAVGLLLLEAMPLEDAIAMVRTARPEIRINAEQLAWLRDVEARLAGDRKRSG